jgi:hypothetical protein
LVGPNNIAYIEDLIATGAKLCGTRIPEGCADKANFLIVKHFSRFTALAIIVVFSFSRNWFNRK